MYHEDRGLRQPRDLEELLSVSDEYGIMLYGWANARNLQYHNDRDALRIEIAHACRSSDDTSRRLIDQKQERAESGLPMGTRLRVHQNGMKLVLKEAEVIREIFARFGKGENHYAISVDLNKRGINTAKGRAWTEAAIRQLKNTRVASISASQRASRDTGKSNACTTLWSLNTVGALTEYQQCEL
jgi:hypothetical protein